MTNNRVDRQSGTRERLLDAAERLFAERGFDGTSVREIADAAKVNLGAINYHFRSKKNLYTEVFARRGAFLRDPVVAAARATEGIARTRPDEALRILGHAFLAPYKKSSASLCLLGLFAREVIEACLPAGLLLREFVKPTSKAVAGVMREIRPDLRAATAQACAHSFIAQLMQIVKGASIRVMSADRQIDHVVRFTVAAVLHLDDVSRKLPRRKSKIRHRN
ncbi:MAG: TetR/AcrR family transcriptional regulator [Vicinamibacteria bacterium]|nr:TetR/AcrR family transcriptional regulator [Vicinamibacteria bacterium]